MADQDDQSDQNGQNDQDKQKISRNRYIHWILSLVVAIGGLWQIQPLVMRVLSGEHLSWFLNDSWRSIIDAIGLVQLPRVMISLALILMSIGLVLRARIAWVLTLVLLLFAVLTTLFLKQPSYLWEIGYYVLIFVVLLRYSWMFARSSVAAGTLYAAASLAALIWYTVVGSLYLGTGFKPEIVTLTDSIYFSFVTLTTVGYGDILPVSSVARYFVVSVIVIGITVFSTAIGAVFLPLLTSGVGRLLRRKERLSMKENHVILCGATPLAMNLYESLTARGENVTVLLSPGTTHTYSDKTDIVFGDAYSDEVLQHAGVMQATYVLAAREEDADNAFIVLAVKGLEGCRAKTVAVVNNSQNLEKIRQVKPDILFSPQYFGAQVLSKMLSGEKIDLNQLSDFFMSKPHQEGKSIAHKHASQPAAPASADTSNPLSNPSSNPPSTSDNPPSNPPSTPQS